GLGTAIWQGLKAGIEAGLGAIKDAVTGLFHKVIGWAESALGIASPSKVFHGIGQNAVKGFIHGVGSMGGDLKKAVIKIAENAATSIYHAAGGLLHGGAATGSGRNRNIGQQLAAKYGWGAGANWANLDALWQQESGWSNTAKNPSSGAYGIAQALPPTKMPFSAQEAGGSNAAAQIAWGLSYIKSRYGSPIAAMAHEQSVGWYDKGGVVPGSGPQLAVVHGGETIVPTHKAISHHIDDIASSVVRWGSVAKRFFLETNRGDMGIPTVRMQRDYFNHWIGRGISRAQMVSIIPWWEREGFFEQLASRKAIKKFDSGGWLPPGLSLAMNGTGRPERVVGPGGGSPMVVNLVLDGKVLASQLIDPLRGQSQIYKQRTGRQAFA
ncbi:MAG TPA: hypothetical protein VNH41_00875, partial [Steroidobacteraceae bacterium]|nr:hypothetical protein [Steroidobacteraceae bacterium]